MPTSDDPFDTPHRRGGPCRVRVPAGLLDPARSAVDRSPQEFIRARANCPMGIVEPGPSTSLTLTGILPRVRMAVPS
eukprot:scaffold4516_cov417-Prasinococcus_capsulatus_cf.AAC.22